MAVSDCGWRHLPSLPKVLAHLGHIGREVESLGPLFLPVAF